MLNNAGIDVRMSADIDANCVIEYEVTGEKAFLALADGAVALHFTDAEAFRNFMQQAMKVLAEVGLNSGEAAERNS